MFLVYNDDLNPRKGGSFSMPDINPNDMYLKHFENSLYLTFIHTNSQDFHEKHRAAKELEIAARKMKYWERMQTFDLPTLVPRLEAAKAVWKTDARRK